MALALTSGGESRLDGAPAQPLPSYEDMVQAAAVYLVSQDQEGALYGGDPANARADAIQMVRQQEEARWRAEDAASQQRQQEIAAAGAERNRMRAARQGVVPESLPMDGYGAVSGRTVQEANRPLEDAEAALAMEQEAADGVIRGMREGQRNWGAEGDYAYLQERGERFPNAAPGERDMDYRNRIRQRRGQTFYTSDGTAIPVGREPTPQEIEAERQWDDWANQTPGSERQALYDPQAYEAHREGVREGIRDDAQENMATYGNGVSEPAVRADLGLAPLSPEQEEARARRARSEDRVRNAQRGRFYAQRLQADTGLPAGVPIEVMEAERGRQRQAARNDDLERRRALVAQRGELRGAGLSPAVGDARNRFDDLIDRLGQPGMNGWQQAGIIAGLAPNAETANPTPLGVDAMGMQNALRFVNNEAIAGMDPLRRQAAMAQMQQQEAALPPEQKVALSIARQEPMGTGLSAGPVNEAWNSAWSEGGFREQMEGLGYQPHEIDAWIDERRNRGPEDAPRAQQAPGPGAAPSPPPAQPPVRRAPQGGGRGGRTAQPPNTFGGPRGGRGTGSRVPRR